MGLCSDDELHCSQNANCGNQQLAFMAVFTSNFDLKAHQNSAMNTDLLGDKVGAVQGVPVFWS